jgi:hypothetical protein
MDPVQSVEALKLFNEKAEKLAELSFTEFAIARGTSFTVSASQGQPVTVDVVGPAAESIDAFVLTVRFFIQDKDHSSLRNLAAIYDGVPMSHELKEAFAGARQRFNGYLDQPAGVEVHGEALTRRRIVDVFVYGGLAHAEPEKKTIFDNWMSLPIMAEVLRHKFLGTLMEFIGLTAFIHDLNLRTIAEIENGAP